MTGKQGLGPEFFAGGHLGACPLPMHARKSETNHEKAPGKRFKVPEEHIFMWRARRSLPTCARALRALASVTYHNRVL